MKLLAIDTSTNVCSICISDSDRVVAEYVTRSALTHTERVMPAIDFLFSHLDWNVSELDGLAVINGPGSFTGLRISLSLIKGLSYALNLPVVAANALEVAARQIPLAGLICPAMDARRGEIFAALYQREGEILTQRSVPASISPAAFRKELPEAPIFFCGPGAKLYWNELKNHTKSRLLFTDFILARTLALVGLEKFQKGEVIAGGEIKAAYLRPSDAEAKGPRTKKRLESIPRR